jgi:hypothetical protein
VSKSSQPKAKQAPHQIWRAETKADAGESFDLFIKIYEQKYPKAKWRRLCSFNSFGKAITGIEFRDGFEITQTDQVAS